MSEEGNSQHLDQAIEPLPQQLGLGPVGKGISAAAGAAISAAFPPIAIPVAGMVEALHTFGGKLQEVQEKRVDGLMVSAAIEAGISPDDVVHRLMEREDLILLTAEAVDAARRTLLAGKAETLGRSLGAILSDDALLDLESIWIRIVSVVEPPHIRVLGLLVDHAGTTGSGSKLWGTGTVLTVIEIGHELGVGEAALPLVLDLEKTGLVTVEPVISSKTGAPPEAYDQQIRATGLGAQLFAKLSQSGLKDLS
ncbi:hypothetical protein ACIQTW_19605 [Paenarthrobacter sp. NPDC090517]|uniref:hypothetical protein n=1 Tax=Paenarthrobacter sp. NPDC090517 TaxID=3364381 RepID=UPI0038257BE3